MQYVSRSEWGARSPKGVTTISNSNGMFVHYTADPAPSGVDAEKSTVKAIQNFHMDGRGWRDIAYSWLVGQSGKIYEGRGWGVAGGHTAGYNSSSHAVCWLGGPDNVPTQAALQSINVVIAEHNARFGAGYVKGHGEVNSTSCPGSRLQAWINAGRPVDASPPSPPPIPDIPEETEMQQVILRDSNNAYWLVQGVTKVHIPSSEHLSILLYLGVKNQSQGDSTKLLETLGELPTRQSEQVLLRDNVGAIWLCKDNTKVHVPSVDHLALLLYLGVKDATNGDSTKLLETLGTIEV